MQHDKGVGVEHDHIFDALREVEHHAEQRARVAQLVTELREPYRTVIVLRYLEELTPTRIADKLGRPVETVHTQLARGLSLLRDALDAQSGNEKRTGAWLFPSRRWRCRSRKDHPTTFSGRIVPAVSRCLLADAPEAFSETPPSCG